MLVITKIVKNICSYAFVCICLQAGVLKTSSGINLFYLSHQEQYTHD